MRYVHRETGAWHDREIADLLALAGDEFTCTDDALKNRRSEWQRKPGLWKEAENLAEIMAQ